MKKILLTGGCSFSAPYSEDWKKTWTDYINKKYNFDGFVHTGLGASGNELIAYRLLYYIQKLLELQKDEEIEIYSAVMWSQVDRIDLFTNNDSLNMDTDNGNIVDFESIDSNIVFKSEDTFVQKVNSFMGKNSGFIRPGGKPYDEDFYRTDNPKQRKWLVDYYNQHYTDEYAIIQTLKNISLIQSQCIKHNIKCLMFGMENLFENERINIDHYPKSKSFLNIVDWDKFIFYEGNNGLYEYTQLNGLDTWEDNFHPHSSTHKHFIDNFDKEIKKIWKIK